MELTVSLDVLARIAIYVALLFLTIYTIMLGYHWFSYGSNKQTSVTALSIFIGGSCLLILGLVVTYNLF